MIKQSLSVILFILASFQVQAADSIPESVLKSLNGQIVLVSSTGDLDKDQIPDQALITSTGNEGTTTLVLRIFLTKAAKEPRETLKSETILCSECRSILSLPNPYTLSINKGVLQIKSFGGSRVSVERATKWRLTDGAFVLIGATELEHDSIENVPVLEIKIDTNFLTGQTFETLTRKNGKVTNKCQTGKSIVRLQDFQDEKFAPKRCTSARVGL